MKVDYIILLVDRRVVNNERRETVCQEEGFSLSANCPLSPTSVESTTASRKITKGAMPSWKTIFCGTLARLEIELRNRQSILDIE